jgi:tetratricopeptide (TPR) repeat protein
MPSTAEIHAIVAEALAARRLEDAAPWQDALLGDGANAPSLTLLGRFHAERGDIAAGLAYTGEALRVDPFNTDAAVCRGNLFVSIGSFTEAAACFERILLFAPLHDQALGAYLHALQQTGRRYEIVEALRRRIRLGGEAAELVNRLGLALHSVGDLPGALAAYQRSQALSPRSPLYHSNAATIYFHLERYDDALAELDRAHAIDPNFATAWFHTGNLRRAMCEPRRAEEAFRRVIALAPDHAEAHFALGCMLLQQDRWAEGWVEYEWRWRVPGLVAPIDIDTPRWAGEDLTGRRILVVAEQGSGDTIQYIRYASTLQELGAEVYLWAPPESVALLRRLPFLSGAATNRFELPRCDYHVPTLSLPRLLHAAADRIAAAPYLTPEPTKLARFTKELGARREHLRVGIAWAGNSVQVEDRHRSAQLVDLAPLFALPGLRWIGLQKGPEAAQIARSGLPVEDWSARLESFEETAALMGALDGVVSVCSAPLHLAGALGVRSVALLAWAPDWRWRADEIWTPYYAGMRIARMRRLNDWEGIARRAAQIVASWKPNTPRP